MDLTKKPGARAAFTLIELLVVITIIAILMAILFPAFKGVQDQAKRTQAKNDVTQIVTAVNAYFTEYGKYPVPSGINTGEEDFTYDSGNSNKTLMQILIAQDAGENPKAIVFMQPAPAKTQGRYGLQEDNTLLDNWGNQYYIRIDVNYNNVVRDPVDDSKLITNGVLAWSAGLDGQHQYNAPSAPVNEDNVWSFK